MALATVQTATVVGLDAVPIQVEVDLALGLPYFDIVGLAEGSVRESRVRIQAALRNSGITLPQKRITVGLAPANIRKEGSAFDLPIALGILAAAGLVDPDALSSDRLFVGELSLTGTLRSVSGVLPLAVMARRLAIPEIIVPEGNGREAAVVRPLAVRPAASLRQLVDWLCGEGELPLQAPLGPQAFGSPSASPDFVDVLGQGHAKRALEVAAAGGHNVLMVGPPGAGKTMLARRLPGILPPLTFDEALETTLVYSVLGQLSADRPWLSARPFRSPHHSASDAGLIGGGTVPRPGEISMAHNGVLFLDELLEFRRNVLEALRQPLEERRVTIARAQGSLTFPAAFMLVGAMNPCPCGRLGDPSEACRCSFSQIERYRSRVSQPLLERLDIHLEIPAVKFSALATSAPGESSAAIRERVRAARERQQARFESLPGVFCNAQIPDQLTARLCPVEREAQDLLGRALERWKLSARVYHRLLRISRTLADLEGRERLAAADVAEALQYRSFERGAEIARGGSHDSKAG